jgi:hypothetical protein
MAIILSIYASVFALGVYQDCHANDEHEQS